MTSKGKHLALERNCQKKIINAIVRLLKTRNHSIKEILEKLTKKNYKAEEIEKGINYCKKAKILDDNLFAEEWISWRLSNLYGLKRIRFELTLKGISEEKITSTIQKHAENFKEEEIIYNIAYKKFQKNSHKEKTIMTQRIYNHLLLRGFDAEAICKVLKRFHCDISE